MANAYKETMNLPKTDFAMRANLPENEPKRLQKWEEEDLYHLVLEKNKEGKTFVLHDGPPYANGSIHIGHAFNKIIKDFVNKSHAQRGYYTPYIPGWDCHGQPIEHIVEERLGPEKMKQTDQPTLRKMCRDWAVKCIDDQRESFKRLGVNADWDHPYLTFTPDYEAGDVEIFKEMYLNGSIYRGRKPVHWCSHCHTALAEAEIEYGDETSPSIYVKFKLDSIPGLFEAAGVEGDVYVLIWTTTPWTLPANSAVCLAPDADYVMVLADGCYMIMARVLVEEVAQKAGWSDWMIVEDASGRPIVYKGRELTGMSYTCPVREDLKGSFIYGDFVTLDTGTGVVHTAPGHGQDDYLVGLEFDLPMRMPVDDDGVLTSEAGPFAGLNVWDANPVIIDWLRERGALVAEEQITHSYPHCWRCHEPVIFRATSQWFVDMDKNSLRENTVNDINNKVTFYPGWASNRIGSMVAERPDWCLSRQRNWGVPIPVFKCKKCGATVANEATFDAVIELFRKEGSDAWYIRKPSEYLPHGTACEECGCTDLEPDKDILDVWWDSGVSHTSVLKHRADEGLTFPADMYLEGSDQHRGWFQSSILTSEATYGVPPYKSVLSCGFIVDGQGRKMSKSLGNGVDPADVVDKRGADVLRLWVASVDYSQDVSISDEILDRTSEAYRRIRNSFRFLLGSLSDFDDERDSVRDWDALEPIDQWALVRTKQLVEDVEAGYDDYKYHVVYRAIYDYVVNDLSAVYMDATKDRLYSEAPNSPRRRAVQTVMYQILEALERILAPILSFTTDEVWEHYPEAIRNREGRPVSVQLAGWPRPADFVPAIPEGAEEQVMKDFGVALSARDAVTKAIEEARAAKLINKSQEAAVEVAAPSGMLEALRRYDESVYEDLFIVSSVSLVEGDELTVGISKAPGEKCPRCWNYRELGGNAHHPKVCARCGDALDEIGYVEEE